MLTHIETGYEGKFDFPARREKAEFTYLLASLPRAGSTYVSHLLWRTGCLGAPLEYLNFEAGGPYGFARESTELQSQLWRSILRRRCSPNGVFGLKAFPQQLEHLQRTNPSLLKEVFDAVVPHGKSPKVVYLRRGDRIAQVVSYARASLSGVWRKELETEESREIDYSEQALDAAERGIAFQEAAWAQMFADLQIEPLTIWCEDALAEGTAVAESVAAYLGVSIDRATAPDVPSIEKQSEGNSADWIERYARSRGLA